ncbi:MAG: zinc-ribbon domain-containing protein [Oscillospiraceae bacterium]|nr:zinc-ribbon domain-containing protein [Oscillospiraceae bacterium]
MTPKKTADFTAKCRVFRDGDVYQYTFFCDICENGYTTSPVQASGPGEAQALAEAEARLHFNWCRRCRRWVCDEHFNENQMMCTDCAPRICLHCGAEILRGDQFCTRCGTPQYETTKERME